MEAWRGVLGPGLLTGQHLSRISGSKKRSKCLCNQVSFQVQVSQCYDRRSGVGTSQECILNALADKFQRAVKEADEYYTQFFVSGH